MPLIFHKYHEPSGSVIAVWEHKESESELIEMLDPDMDEVRHISGMKPFRRQEWLCSRLLIRHLLPEEPYRLFKDALGKPFLENSPYFLSLSHSCGRAAVIIGPGLVGIDIQRKEDKITRLYPKFISDSERKMLDENHLPESCHIFWGAKEAMYKAYGKKSLDFRKHMHLYAFKYFRTDLELSGFVHKNETRQDYDIFTHLLDDFYLVYAIHDNTNTDL